MDRTRADGRQLRRLLVAVDRSSASRAALVQEHRSLSVRAARAQSLGSIESQMRYPTELAAAVARAARPGV